MKKAILVLMALLIGTVPAWAVLGQSVESVRSDQEHLKGQLRSTTLEGFSVQQINSADGTVVKEFVSPSGMVFGISWEAPTMPNLAQLLGTYYTQFQQAPRSAVHRRGPLTVRTDQLVVESGGHMRAFHGRAYVTGLLPGTLSAEVIR
jgi:hypothetical protein